LALLLVFTCIIIGLGISAFTGTNISLWLLIGFSIIFSIEYWYYYQTRKHVYIGRIYKTFLNIALLSVLGLCIWSGIQVFSKQFFQNQLIGSIIFIAEIICLIWLLTVLNRNRNRRPSMKVTAFSLLCLFIIFAFAGVQPFEQYKDSAFSAFNNWSKSLQSDAQETGISTQDNSASESNQNIITETILNPKWWSGTDEKSITSRSQELFELTNEERINNGLSSLQRNTQLDKLAQEKAESMDQANVQTGLTHCGFEERARIAQSIGFNTVAENIAYGGFEASSFIDMWMSSPLHKANMLDRRFTHIGIGIYGKYAVQFFGRY
jgi:uncharacterized protein YkwD